MKRLISFFLALMMVLSLTVAVSAAELDVSQPGSITITNVSPENEYAVYKMLDLVKYDDGTKIGSYRANDEQWAAFFRSTAAQAYVSIDEANYVTWIGGDEDSDAATFAKLALAYAKANSITPTAVSSEESFSKAEGIDICVFDGLELGYYLIDSTMGAACGLTTTAPDVVINGKNSIPTVNKQVQEDSDSQWGKDNNAQIGQTINFRTTIKVTSGGAENYVIHDSMTEGLTFNPDSVSVTVNGQPCTLENPFTIEYHDHEPAENFGTCTFDVVFSQEFCNSLQKNDEVVVYYSATLNEKASIGPTDPDTNKAALSFGENHITSESTTKTYTYGIEIVKTDADGKTLLNGAKFKIYDSSTGGNEIMLVKETDENGKTFYRLSSTATESIEIEVNGLVKVVGFDNGTYYLQETAAPSGYNPLTSRKSFTIANDNLYADFIGDVYSTQTGVQVVNKVGSRLPETGAAGTMMFITFGMLTVLATGVLLVTKKRMSMIEE